MHFWCHFGCYWEVFLSTFPVFVKNGAPHGNAINSSEIEGPAPQKSKKKVQKLKKKRQENEGEQNNGFLDDFGSILGGFGDHFGGQKAFKNRVKCWMRFWRPKKGPGRFFWVGQAECAGPVGG